MFKDDDKVVQVAMQIVISAGDARNAAGKALDCVAAFDLQEQRSIWRRQITIFVQLTMLRQR